MNNNVKERPVLFSGDMIRALLQEYSMPGQYKNQTRRTHGLNPYIMTMWSCGRGRLRRLRLINIGNSIRKEGTNNETEPSHHRPAGLPHEENRQWEI